MDFNNFKEWMELATDLSEKTIKNYIGAIEKIDADLQSRQMIVANLERVTSGETLEELKQKYFSIPEVRDLDTRGKNMYSAGFNKYILFREVNGNDVVGKEGIVYILSNPAMPGLVKIGKTINLDDRMKSLFSTGIPLPFRCVYAKKVSNYNEVERKLHKGLSAIRENPNREFFRIAEEEVINFLELIPGVEVTPKGDNFEDKADEIAFERASKLGQRFNFDSAGILVGSTLNFVRDEQVTCRVISKTRVEFEGEDHSLSSAALIAIKRMGYEWKSIAGPLNWKHEGVVIDTLRRRLEDQD
jgi:hypothetical protein